MSLFVVTLFVLTYLGMALGRVPGLRLDRTGIAVMAVAALLASGEMDIASIGQAVDGSTILLLFALMILSAQFQQAGLYSLCAATIVRSGASPALLLGLVTVAGGLLSAFLANDIVVFALTPLLCTGIAGRGGDPRPYLIALAGASNAGSAATLIGNPQNILIGQTGDLDFWAFSAVCAPPALAALLLVYASVWIVWRRELAVCGSLTVTALASAPADGWQIAKGAIATGLLIALFVTDLPREAGALAIAAVLLASRRMASRDMIGAVDWHLLLLIACLFTVTAAFGQTRASASFLDWLQQAGLGPDSLSILGPITLLSSNSIGNVPAVILITGLWPTLPQGALYGLALLSTLAGNMLIVGSLANIIVAERAAAAGLTLSFRDFARAGIPMTIGSMSIASMWLLVGGWIPFA